MNPARAIRHLDVVTEIVEPKEAPVILSVAGLDNPIYCSLTTRHVGLATGETLARRFPREVSPLMGVREETPEAFGALAELMPEGAIAAVFLQKMPSEFQQRPTEAFGGLTLLQHFPVEQMVWIGSDAQLKREIEAIPLGDAHSEAMIALTGLTHPGPFDKRTHELGSFWGIFEDGRLAAMAGERLRGPGWREVSAVCTHPDYQGRGYGAALVSKVVRGMVSRGETPILHVTASKLGPRRVYFALGFEVSRVFEAAVLKKGGQPGEASPLAGVGG